MHWLTAWPEWEIARLFLPPPQRETAAAWGALLDTLTAPGRDLGDAAPALALHDWWKSELRGWSAGRYRHPLGAALRGLPAPWQSLADALPGLPGEPRPGVAAAVAEVEAALFDGRVTAAATRMILGDLHMAWVLHGDSGVASRLDAGPIAPDATRVRRLWSAMLRARLERLRQGRVGPSGPLLVLFGCWRAARG